MDVNILTNDKNTLEFELIKSDASIAYLLVEKLNEDKSVEFAATKLEHPLVGTQKIIVKTKRKEPLEVVLEKLDEISKEIEEFRKEFKSNVK